MNDLVKTYTADIDLLLTDVCMAGALYGLDLAVTRIADHLRDLPRTEGAAMLAQAMSKISLREFTPAIELTQRVLNNPQLVAFHPEAQAFQRLAEQLRDGQVAQPLSPSV
jgi:hypothetical protein